MKESLHNKKNVLVTGSSRGIGFAIAESFNLAGYHVILNGRDAYTLQLASSMIPGSSYIIGDVSNLEDIQNIKKEIHSKFGVLDILICNVGSGRSVPPGEETYEEWQRVFKTNLWSTTNTIETLKDMLILSKGVIVCISSICGIETIIGAPLTYSAAKAALHSYIRGISRPLGAKGVRINGIALGNILFENSVWDQKLKEDQNKVMNMLNNEVPLKKFGTTKDVTNLVTFLTSDKSEFATGSIWTLDGGQTH